MQDYDIIFDKEIGNPFMGLDSKVIYIECRINKYPLIEKSSLDECIFICCRIRNMEIKNLEDPIEMLFLNCTISNLEIDHSEAPHLQFLGCILEGAKFENSNLAGFTSSKNTTEDLEIILKNLITGKNRLKKKFKSLKKLQILVPSITDSKFLFCDMNDLLIDNTLFTDNTIKHCNLEYVEFIEKVKMKDVDIRGTKIFNSDFGDCHFENIRFNKFKFPQEFLMFFLSIVFKIRYNRNRKKYPETSPRKKGEKYRELLEKKRAIILKEVRKCKEDLKKKLYDLNIYKLKLHKLVDYFSTTNINQTEYEEADFSEAYYLFWYIQDLEYIDNFKKKHRFLAFISHIFTNYMRSFGRLLFAVAFVILIFSISYINCGTFKIDPLYKIKEKIEIINEKINPNIAPPLNLKISLNCFFFTFDSKLEIKLPNIKKEEPDLVDEKGRPKDAFYLSCKIFLNNDIYPLQEDDDFTKCLMIGEILMGYLALTVFLSIIFSHISQRIFMPKKMKKR